MVETPHSLLERLRQMPHDNGSWHFFVGMYTPLIRKWLGRSGLQEADVEEVVQDVMQVVVRELEGFRHNQRPGAFRAWLRTIARNRLSAFLKKLKKQPRATGHPDTQELLQGLEDPRPTHYSLPELLAGG